MRTGIILLILMVLGTNQLPAQYIMGLDKKEGAYYRSETDVLFSGEIYSFFESGQIRLKYRLVNGKFEGAQQHLNEKGRLVKEIYFRNGHEDGKYKEYYPCGKKIRQEGFFKENQPYGTWLLYNSKGEIIKKEVYGASGERISMRTF